MFSKFKLISLPLLAITQLTTATPNLNINWLNSNSNQFSPAQKAVINSAITDWENYLHVPIARTIDITFNAVSIPDALGQAYNVDWNHLGNPTAGLIEISTDFSFFIDPTPNAQTEFPTATTPFTYDANPGSPAYNQYDLKSLVLHEIGHIVGFNDSFGLLYAAQNPNLPNNPIQLNNQTVNFSDGAHFDHDTDLMGYPGYSSSQRANISDIDRQFLNQFFDYNNTQYYSATAPNQNLNDITTNGNDTTYIDLKFVNEHFSIQDVDLALHLEHEFSELEVTLISPDGTEVLLFSEDYFVSIDENWTRFNDEVDSRFNIVDPVYYDEYQMQPRGLLADFDNQDAYGQWRLKIIDLAPDDRGFFHNATLILTDEDILGDFNDDNLITQQDLDLIMHNFGAISPSDINADSITGLAELFAFRNATAALGQTSASTIPEPAGLLFLIGTAMLLPQRRQLA